MLRKYDDTSDDQNLWPGYVDIISLTLFVILFIFIIFFMKYQYLGFLVGKGEKDIQAIRDLFQDDKDEILIIKDGKIIIQESVLFDFGKSDIKEDGKDKLRKIGVTLKKYLEDEQGKRKSKFSIIVEGHTDTVGTHTYNFGLSFRRAKAVTDYWQEELDFGTATDLKIDLLPAGYGETRLLKKTPDRTREPANRRIEIRIVPKFDAMLEGWFSSDGIHSQEVNNSAKDK